MDERLLLEGAVPSTSLRNYFLNRELESIEVAYGLMKKLHKTSIPIDHNFSHIKDWCAALDKPGGEEGIRTLGAIDAAQRFSRPPH